MAKVPKLAIKESLEFANKQIQRGYSRGIAWAFAMSRLRRDYNRVKQESIDYGFHS